MPVPLWVCACVSGSSIIFMEIIMIPAASHCASSLRRNPFNRIQHGSITARLRLALFTFCLLAGITAAAQTDSIPVFKGAIAANRSKTYNNIVKNIIAKNLSLPLTDSTEENWQDAFYAMEVLQYKQPWVLEKIKYAFEVAVHSSPGFQRSLLELVYSNYPSQFKEAVYPLAGKTTSAKVFAMAASYIVHADAAQLGPLYLIGLSRFPVLRTTDSAKTSQAILRTLEDIAKLQPEKISAKQLEIFFSASFLQGNTVLYSIQRKNRNYPGIAIIRDRTGKFVTDSLGDIFSVPQLARSITNLPGYLTNGNTPQGIFRMNGFAVSRSAAIGPTENIQLMMPFETSPQFFLKDSSITDTTWNTDLYERLLPDALKKYHPLLGTYTASACGRTEIIAHGTTVDLNYYKGQPYYPHTPTQGCLCTKEIWSGENGQRMVSDQQKLVNALKKAGGANGYCVVIEIDDQQKPVSMEDLLPYIKAGGKQPDK